MSRIMLHAAISLLSDGAAPELLEAPVNAYRLALHPKGMAPRILNFAEWAQHILERLHQESMRNPNDRLADLRAELEQYVPERVITPDHLGFAVPLKLRSAHHELHLTTTITTFATAVDVTVSELKLEAFLPADEATALILSMR